MSTRQMLWRALALLGLALLMSGCAPNAATSTRATSSQAISSPGATPTTNTATIIDGPSGPPPITLKDTSPGQLALALNLSLGDYTGEMRDKIGLSVSFTHAGRLVQFVADEHVSCNGLALQSAWAGFSLAVPSAALSGKRVTCIYTSGNTSATFSFTCPLAPAILSPQENAQVARSKHTNVSYRISPDWAYYVIALGPPKKAWTPEAPHQPNPVTLDTSTLGAGPGFIAIHQFFTVADLRGSGFQSVKEETGTAVYQIPVTWV